MESSDEKEEVLSRLRKTRKAFIPEYLGGLFLLILLLIMQYKGVDIGQNAKYFVGGLALMSLVSPELTRLMHRYNITTSKLVIIDGLIKQHKKHVYFYPLGFVPDINVKQNRLQRLMNYGTIFIRMSAVEAAEVKDIDCPHKIMKILEKQIEKNKKHHVR